MHCRYGLCCFLAILGLLGALPAHAGDPVATLPAPWTDKLLPVPEPIIDGQKPDVRLRLLEARKAVADALQNPDAPAELAGAYGELGGHYQVNSLRQSAEQCYENAMRLAPEKFRWAYYYAWLAATTGRPETAIQRFEHARPLEPEQGYPALTLRIADARLELNDLDKARTTYQRVVDVPGLEAAARYGLGQISLLRRDYANAIENFNRVLEIQPEASQVHYPLAQALRGAGQNEEARAHLAQRGEHLPAVQDELVEELEALKNPSRALFMRALKAIRKHDYPTARDAFTEALALEPDNLNARTSYARTLYLTDDKAGARQELKDVLATRPDTVLALFLLGVMLDEEGDTAGADRYYRQVLELDPAHGGAHFYLANHDYRQGDFAAAGEHYARAIAADPMNVPAHMLYLAILDKTGAPDSQVKTQLETALRQHPEMPAFSLQLIVLLSTSNDPEVANPDEALRLAQQLVEQQPIPPNREALALACGAAGEYERAAAIQAEIMSFAVWTMPSEADRLAKGLASYQDGKMPSPDMLPGSPPIQPRPVDGAGPFSDYPAAKPY